MAAVPNHYEQGQRANAMSVSGVDDDSVSALGCKVDVLKFSATAICGRAVGRRQLEPISKLASLDKTRQKQARKRRLHASK
jgi:hypothetical protein